MSKDRPNERVEKQDALEGQQTRFDALDLMKEGVPKHDKVADEAAVGEQAAKLRLENYAKVAEQRDASFDSAMQALDRGDDAPARKLISSNDKEIALTKQVIARITGQAEQESMRAWST